MMHSIDRRIGKFSIARRSIAECPDVVRAIMASCIIVRCEFLYHTDGFEYVAISPEFDELKKGEWLPEYRAGVEGRTVTWTKIDAS